MLSTMITKWDLTCDKKLHRIIGYNNNTLDLTMISWVSEETKPHELCQNVFGDADFAGDAKTMRSTSGVYCCLANGSLPAREPKGGSQHAAALKAQEQWKNNNRGPQGTVPTTLCQLTAASKKQTAVSHSTPEAEYIAAHHAIRAEGLPLQDLLEPLFGAGTLHFFEDNETCSLAVRTGKAPSMKHLNRTHKVDIAWLHERHEDKAFILHDCASANMRAAIFTKPFVDKVKWSHACTQFAHDYIDSKVYKPCIAGLAPAAPAVGGSSPAPAPNVTPLRSENKTATQEHVRTDKQSEHPPNYNPSSSFVAVRIQS